MKGSESIPLGLPSVVAPVLVWPASWQKAKNRSRTQRHPIRHPTVTNSRRQANMAKHYESKTNLQGIQPIKDDPMKTHLACPPDDFVCSRARSSQMVRTSSYKANLLVFKRYAVPVLTHSGTHRKHTEYTRGTHALHTTNTPAFAIRHRFTSKLFKHWRIKQEKSNDL
jgi:hypothetical protein